MLRPAGLAVSDFHFISSQFSKGKLYNFLELKKGATYLGRAKQGRAKQGRAYLDGVKLVRDHPRSSAVKNEARLNPFYTMPFPRI